MSPTKSILSAILATVGLAVPAAARSLAEWHYIVVEVDSSGVLEPVYHTRVQLAAPRPSLSPDQAVLARLRNHYPKGAVDVELSVGGEVIFRDVVAFERFVHVEFPVNKEGSLVRADFALPRAAAVVRVPAEDGATLAIRTSAATSLDLDLDRIDQLAAGFRLAGAIPRGTASSLGSTGSPSNRVDLLIMGDGYTAAQQTAFAADASNVVSAFFSITPYSEYRNYVNVSTLFTASSQSGADHPPYLAQCSGDNVSCCSDPEALNDPLAGTYRTTAFDARYCSFMIHRLLVVDTAKVLAAAAAVPDWDKIFVLVNDGTYGGSGGFLAVTSTNGSAVDVIRHEYGHSFSRLADEYDSPFPGFSPCSDISGPPCEPNVTDQTSFSTVKWRSWILPTTPVPTPEGSSYSGVLGLFEGARYQSTGMYRPRESQCLMQFLGQPFCSICAQAYVKALYDGGWGVPAAGIDPIEPGSESPPSGTVQVNDTQRFSVGVLSPVGGPPPAIEWRVNGTVQAGQTSSSFLFGPPAAGAFTVTVTVADATPLVSPAMAGTSLSSSRQWTANASGPSSLIFADGFESGNRNAWQP
ncbi:MAG TPA: M64 family metallopeptidase [Thermoanaerobaculia bacterium]|nr:M64 family metallopeptidase [Thermoanaerobaculia bacterium]